MKAQKYIVWTHYKTSSVGHRPMLAAEARRLAKWEEAGLLQSNGCLPTWPRIEIRRADNPPVNVSAA